MRLDQAISIAARAFEDKFDKSGDPYILHCLQVMNNVDKWNDTELKIIAVLHYLIEDTEWSIVGLIREYKASHRLINALIELTHVKGVPYDTYISGICLNQDAIKVKMADIEHNSSILRLKGIRPKDLERIEKYHRAYMRLKEALKS